MAKPVSVKSGNDGEVVVNLRQDEEETQAIVELEREQQKKNIYEFEDRISKNGYITTS